MPAAKTKNHDDIILNYENLITDSLSATPETLSTYFQQYHHAFFRFCDRHLESAILNYENLISD